MQIFQENVKKQGFRHDILRIFKKFLCQIVPHQFYVPLCPYLEPRKKIFFIYFLRFFGPKKNFFDFFQKNNQNQLEIIF